MHRNEEKRFFNVRRVLTRATLGIAALFLVSGTPISTGAVPPAQAQVRGGTIHGQAGISPLAPAAGTNMPGAVPRTSTFALSNQDGLSFPCRMSPY